MQAVLTLCAYCLPLPTPSLLCSHLVLLLLPLFMHCLYLQLPLANTVIYIVYIYIYVCEFPCNNYANFHIQFHLIFLQQLLAASYLPSLSFYCTVFVQLPFSVFPSLFLSLSLFISLGILIENCIRCLTHLHCLSFYSYFWLNCAYAMCAACAFTFATSHMQMS